MRYDVAVIGAGVFGSWTAWHLRRAGLKVLLVDAWGPGHSRSSSGGESRIIRMGYGPDAIYTRMAARSLVAWQKLKNPRLFHRTGVLWIGRDDDAYTCATRKTLTQEGVPIEVFDAGELARRFPQMRVTAANALGIWEPESGALMARQAVTAVAEEAIANGVEYRQAFVDAAHQGIDAGVFVYACGPWLPKLFPDLLGNRIFPTRQEVFFFAAPTLNLPVWIDFTDPRGPYGFPDLENRGVKLAFDKHGEPFDPDTGDRLVSKESVTRARAFMAERFPSMRDAALTETRVCQYENTSNGDFLIDRHPDFENLWLVGGGSGHGFKHGPAVGEYAASQILANAPSEPRFSLATKKETQSREVF
jgi:glycine/D-amino acid oxidase-like deaminating enzyme